jgi:glutamyl-tRNA synthetase
MPAPYRGRLAPSPTGFLHAGHAATFLAAAQRAVSAGGTLILRNDDLDGARCKPEFTRAALEDLRWLGIEWQEGPDTGGPHAPYTQSERLPAYRAAFEELRRAGWVYPCKCSRKEIASALSAPHPSDEEPVYAGTCRPQKPAVFHVPLPATNWRFRIPERECLRFDDLLQGPQQCVAGRDFGDFLVWRKDGFPSYQLASCVDDSLMHVSEIVRGADLITSTFRQLLLWRAMGKPEPAFYHCNLITDATGKRLAKRDNALALRSLRAAGWSPGDVASAITEGRLSSLSPPPRP